MPGNSLTTDELTTLSSAAGCTAAEFESNVSDNATNDGITELKAIAARIKALGG